MENETLHASTFTKDQLCAVVSTIDDNVGNHIVWVDTSGYIHITTLHPGENSPLTLVKEWDDIKFRMETLCAGAGYMGKAAADDEHWMRKLHEGIQWGWNNGMIGYIDYY